MTISPRPVPTAAQAASVLNRLSESKRLRLANGPERLSILDQLSVPKNVDELEMQINDWKDCSMFFPMEGQPRAYMKVPVLLPNNSVAVQTGEDALFVRWVYVVIGWVMAAPQTRAEPLICEQIWKKFIELRRQYDALYPDHSPLLLWRRHAEVSVTGRRKAGEACFEHQKRRCKECAQGPVTRVTVRVAIPGLDLTRTAAPDSSSLPMLKVDMGILR